MSETEIQPAVEPAITVEYIVEHIIRDVAELPDRTSPEEWPEAMIVTGDELERIVTDHVAPALAQRDQWLANTNSAADREASIAAALLNWSRSLVAVSRSEDPRTYLREFDIADGLKFKTLVEVKG